MDRKETSTTRNRHKGRLPPFIPKKPHKNKTVTKRTRWTYVTVKLLIKLRCNENIAFKNRYALVPRLWTCIASQLNGETGSSHFTGRVCSNKWHSLLKTYRAVSLKISAGIGPLRHKLKQIAIWPYYQDFRVYFKLEQNQRYKSNEDDDDNESTQSQRSSGATKPIKLWTVEATRELIRQRAGMESSFTGPWRPAHELWGAISEKLSENGHYYPWHLCEHRWKVLMTVFTMIRAEIINERLDRPSRNLDWMFYKQILNYTLEAKKKRLLDGRMNPELADENIVVIDLCSDEEDDGFEAGQDLESDYMNVDVIYSNEERFWIEAEEDLENPEYYSTETDCTDELKYEHNFEMIDLTETESVNGNKDSPTAVEEVENHNDIPPSCQ